MVVKGAPWWRSGQVLGAAVVSVLLALHASTDMFSGLERSFFDFASSESPHQPLGQIALIAIDDKSIAALGPLPWPRGIHARLIDKLAQVKPKVVVLALPLVDPQLDPGLVFIQRMKVVLEKAPLQATVPDAAGNDSVSLQQELTGIVNEAEAALDGDAMLARSLQQAGNLLLAANATLAQVPMEKPAQLALPSGQLQAPIDRLASAAAGVGHVIWQPDLDGVVRSVPLLLAASGKVLPSLALLAAAGSLNLQASDIHMASGAGVQLGRLKIGTNPSAAILSHYYKATQGKPAFATDSFADVLSDKTAAAKYANQLVIIGVTAGDAGNVFAVPGNPAMSGAEALAHTLSSILQGHAAYQPVWAIWVALLIAALAGAYIVLVLPTLRGAVAAAITLAWAAALLGLEFWCLAGMGLWLPLVFPATLLVAGHVAHMLRQMQKVRVDEVHRPTADMAQNDRMMGLALQGQGELDLAFERFLQVPMHAAVAEDLYWLAMDFEHKHQFTKAQAVYARLLAFDETYKDAKGRLAAASAMASSASPPVVPSQPCAEPSAPHTQKATLGRYQVEKGLGKGAMGEVYLGQDPRIDRKVALKTMALEHEFDGLGLVDARERFFREAKAAGRLQHPNIVTIFDVGEERGLAFIAMEYLQGQDLQQSCKRGALMPVPRVLSIVARVAQALAYAHRLQVIHRDIKPGNVMYDMLTDTVKVTDFGIARITDGNKTRTGVVLGTPSYMSPEQLAGLPLDGRSDLYALGIMTFQLLTGVLPFRAESMAELMSKIATEEAPDLRQLRPEIPEDLALIVARLLRKSAPDRYQDGDALATDLSMPIRRSQVESARMGSIDLEL
jgi:serine/threonine-protein kinase